MWDIGLLFNIQHLSFLLYKMEIIYSSHRVMSIRQDNILEHLDHYFVQSQHSEKCVINKEIDYNNGNT